MNRTLVDRERPGPPRARIGQKLVLSFVLLVMVLVGTSGWALVELTRRSLEWQMRDHLTSVAQLVGTGVSGDVLRIFRPGWERAGIYRTLAAKLRRAQKVVGARRIYVFDRLGRSLLDTENTPIGQQYHHIRIRDRSEVERALSGEATYSVLFFTEDDVAYMTGYAPIYDRGEVVAAIGVDIGAGFVDSIHVFKRSVLVFAFLSALLTIAVAWGMALTLTRPIQKLVRAAREIGQGNMSHQVVATSDDELGYLGDTMEEMRRKLLARDAELRQMLGGVAHEIRNPLGGIEIYAGLIAEDLPDVDERKQHILKVIQEVRKLDQVISEFLSFARPAPPVGEQVPLASLVADAAFLLAPDMEKTKVDYRVEIAEGLTIFADPEQIKRALFNLMKNAVQAMRHGGQLQVRAQMVEGEVLIEVVDNGPGIAEEVRARLFEPFFTTREKGSGLGLAVVSQTVEENGGRLELQSTQGEGTTVCVHLPSIDRVGHVEIEQGG
ncbi:MAG: ATP-binding protein [Candidatus Latescibacterota bacterium]|jgi:signal transduction histidine kinase